MEDRTKKLFSFTLVAVAVTTAGCAFNQQSKFQMHFLPPAAHAANAAVEIEPPPIEPPKVSLRDVPAIFLASPSVPPRKTRGDELMQRAEAGLQRGRRFYQQKDYPSARRELNKAVDLMLEASDENPSDRQDYEERFD